ncbi:MAG: hypothetical protein JXR41_00670 [Bacteroidales bacterium]|nr:hypothetical protein [Bacteroidales bacterium]
MIRKIYLSVFCLQIVLLLSNMQLCAQAPQLVNYQALLTDQTTGLPVADGEYTVTFSIYDMATGGIPLWAETQTVQITNGVYSVILGNVNPVDAALFSGSERYLGITVGADPEMTPRKQIVSVPYA